MPGVPASGGQAAVLAEEVPCRPAALPRTVGVFTAALAAVAGASAAAGVRRTGWPDPGEWLAAAPFVALLAVAEFLILRFRYRDEINGLNLFEAVLAPLIFAFPVPVVVVVVALAQALANGLRRNRLPKALFNVAQWAAAAGTGSLVWTLLARSGTLTTANVAVLVGALMAVTVLNQLAFTYVLHLAQRRPVRRILHGLAPVIVPGWVLGWAVNTAFGILFVASYQWSPWAIGLFLVPMLSLHWAYRGHGAALADRARLSGLHRATHVLTVPIDPRDALPRFLAEIRTSFECEAVDLVLHDGEIRTVHRVRAGQVPAYRVVTEESHRASLAAELLARSRPERVTRRHPDPVLTAFLRREGWRDCVAAPLVDSGRTVGVLCAYDRNGVEGFEEGELAVLEALAGEAAGAIQKAFLVEAVLEERRKLSEVVNQTSDGIFTLDPEGTVLMWNPALERITGYRAGEMIGAKSLTGLGLRDELGNHVAVERWHADERATASAKLQTRTRDGHVRWLSCSFARVPEGEGQPGLLIVVARDATQQHEVEQLKDDFVATVSHELRTPLTPIKGWTNTLLQHDEALDPRLRREGIEAIAKQADRLERIITDLLAVARIERGPRDVRDEPVNVAAAVGKVVGDFQAGHPERTIRLEVDRGAHVAFGDELYVEQILSNLLGNALKYAPAAEPIDVRLISSWEAVSVQVADRGPGIPRREQERIFDRFQRLGEPLTRSVGGTGLGLYISRRLAHAMGGELTVESEPGTGSLFSLTLRAAPRPVIVL